jgi:hypothetical protein
MFVSVVQESGYVLLGMIFFFTPTFITFRYGAWV